MLCKPVKDAKVFAAPVQVDENHLADHLKPIFRPARAKFTHDGEERKAG